MRTYLYCETGFVEKQDWQKDCWINVMVPDKSDFEYLKDELKVPESFLKDIADTDERPRIEEEDGWLLTVVRIPVQTGNNDIPYTTIPLGIITNEKYTISLCYQKASMIDDFILYTRRKSVKINNQVDLILRIIYSSAVWFLKYLKQINIDVRSAEQALESSIKNEDLLRLMKLQKTLVYFNTSIRGNEMLIGKLKSIFQSASMMDEDLIEDVLIELRQAYNMVNIYSDILTGTMDAFASIISNNVNTIMKRMTSLSIVLMIPTLIASFYGMNVDIHLENYPLAFLYIVICSIVLSALAFIIFRRIKWF